MRIFNKRIFTLIMAVSLFSCGLPARKPEGDLIYCSCRRAGAAGLGTDYCELIADKDSIPKVVIVMDKDNRFGDPVVKRTYEVDGSVVDSLARILAEIKAYKLSGYHLEEPITGGHSYRIYMEYSSGEKINADWYGNHVKDEAILAYNTIHRFFSPWCEKARKEGKIEALTQRVTQMEEIFDRVSAAVKDKKAYPDLKDEVEQLKRYMGTGDWKEDFEADERGELPEGMKRGVLSEDGLYNLLGSRVLHKLLAGQK